jgi:Ca-activated chloride channel homolog
MKKLYTYTVAYTIIATAVNTVVFGVLFLSIWNYLNNNVEEFRFENASFLWWLLALPFLSAGFILYQCWQNATLTQLADVHLLPSLTEKVSNFIPVSRFILLHNALFLLIIAFANPQYGTVAATGKQKGAEIMIALDISNSMLAEDQSNNLNRLTMAKLAINRLLPQLKGDKLGIVIFAGDAYTQVPMTNDYSALKMFLNPVDPTYISRQGTAIGAAIETSMASFSETFAGSKAIIVISDGENHEDDALSSAQLAASEGITIHTIGIGDLKGSPIPIYENGVKKGLKRDQQGNTVITRLNEPMMQDVARAGNGVYIKSNKTRFGLDALLQKIYGMQKAEFNSASFAVYDDQFVPFLIAAFVLLFADMFIFPWKKRRRIILAA